MSTLGSLYIKRGEPEGELCGCTCEVGDWAAQEILRLDALKVELLEALKMLHDDIADYITRNNLTGVDNHVMKAARAAIAKATGETK
jgi:acetamidase/formamidase